VLKNINLVVQQTTVQVVVKDTNHSIIQLFKSFGFHYMIIWYIRIKKHALFLFMANFTIWHALISQTILIRSQSNIYVCRSQSKTFICICISHWICLWLLDRTKFMVSILTAKITISIRRFSLNVIWTYLNFVDDFFFFVRTR
jgi:hypothetical protein